MESSIVLIANPVAKRSSPKKIERAVELLRSSGRTLTVHLTENRGDAEKVARSASERGASLIIAAGGDGTFNEVINGTARTDSVMAILPMGTTNVLAKELGIPEDVETAVELALSGEAHLVSLGSLTITLRQTIVTRFFCLMAGIGFDGEAVYSANLSLKKYSGKGAYVLSGIRTLVRYAPDEMTFIVDGRRYTGYSAIIGKASKYAGHFRITPDASLVNPDLYVFIMHGRRPADMLRYALGMLRGRHLAFKDVTYLRAHSVRVEGNARIQTDGDYIGTAPAEIGVVPEALKLVY